MASALSTPALQRWLNDHHHVVTTGELAALGVSRTTTETLCTRGVLTRVTRGTFVSVPPPFDLETRCRILSALHPGGFVTGPTAAKLAGLRRQPRAVSLHFAVRHGVRLDHEHGVTYRQTTKLAPLDRRVRSDGISVASWPRLAFDLAADLRSLDHRSVIHQMLDQNLVSAEELVAVGARLCHPGRAGSTTFRRSLAEVGLGRSQQSHAEVVLRDLLLARGVPVEAQLAVRLAESGREIHLDLGVTTARWGVELDLHPEHRSLDGHHRDAVRVRSTHGVDWKVEPVSELDLRNPSALADELAMLYRKRVRELPPEV